MYIILQNGLQTIKNMKTFGKLTLDLASLEFSYIALKQSIPSNHNT